jgi:uroporphyrinogen decarboxylase
VYKTVSSIKNELPENIPLIGFSGSPWTLAAYSIEGRSSKDFVTTIDFIKSNKEEAHYFLSRLTDACFLYLRKQVQAGADVIQIFDSWANVLNSEELVEYSINYTKSLIDALKKDQVTSNTPVILFSRDPKCNAETLINTSADCISLYWGMNKFDLDKANVKIAIQGNLNPSILLESKDVIKKETYKILEKFKDFPGYIFNLGHGITPDIDPENIKFLTDIVRKF